MTTAVKTSGSIKGFNRTSAWVQSIRDFQGDKIGYKFECLCGHSRKFLDAYFKNPHGAAVYALEGHRCP